MSKDVYRRALNISKGDEALTLTSVRLYASVAMTYPMKIFVFKTVVVNFVVWHVDNYSFQGQNQNSILWKIELQENSTS